MSRDFLFCQFSIWIFWIFVDYRPSGVRAPRPPEKSQKEGSHRLPRGSFDNDKNSLFSLSLISHHLTDHSTQSQHSHRHRLIPSASIIPSQASHNHGTRRSRPDGRRRMAEHVECHMQSTIDSVPQLAQSCCCRRHRSRAPTTPRRSKRYIFKVLCVSFL